MKQFLAMVAALGLAAGAPYGSAPARAQPATEAINPPPLFAAEMDRARALLDDAISEGVIVPQPKDPGGGYTHERHKKNFRLIYQGGELFRITGEQKYRDYVRDVLLAYAEIYPSLGPHPARKGTQSAGRLFWQVLNDAMWLVDSIRGYDTIRDTLTDAERDTIDNQLFRKAAEFLSTGSAVTFSKIHNHATWATAGVGMTGYVIGEPEFVEIALKGLDKSGETGFLRQTELLFSPDGYYTEGPYYQRFAMKPFVVFAGEIEKHDPSRKIFEHRDGILLKAVDTTIQLTYGGLFFPFNDAIKDKSLNTTELYESVAIAYAKTKDPRLLAIAEFQGRTILTQEAYDMASDLADGKAKPFEFRSTLLSDGPNGQSGAIAVLRDGEDKGLDHMALVAKNASQGFGHGHFDKLSWQLYDNGNEIVRDYGAARFLNIEAKEGGRYLPENTSWAKSSIAHNTLVVNEKSHFDGDVKLADQYAPEQLYFTDGEGLQATSARIATAFPDSQTAFTRTLALVDIEGLRAPVIVDVVRAQSPNANTYDLPLHYNGHIMQVGFETENFVNSRPVLGRKNGYQHIWVDAKGTPKKDDSFITFLKGGRFYTYRFVPGQGMQAILAESGANDPNFNLRRQPILIQRLQNAGNASFVSLLESHGLYDGATEQTIDSKSQIAALNHHSEGEYDIIEIETIAGKKATLAISYDQDESKTHRARMNGRELRWQGFMALLDPSERM